MWLFCTVYAHRVFFAIRCKSVDTWLAGKEAACYNDNSFIIMWGRRNKREIFSSRIRNVKTVDLKYLSCTVHDAEFLSHINLQFTTYFPSTRWGLAAWALSTLDESLNVMKPNPLEWPVVWSRITFTSRISPNWL